MKIPEEFYRLARAFHQDSFDDGLTEREWIVAALQHLDATQRRVVKRFLDDLLNTNPNEAELQRLWSGTQADYFATGKNGLRGFFVATRDQIA